MARSPSDLTERKGPCLSRPRPLAAGIVVAAIAVLGGCEPAPSTPPADAALTIAVLPFEVRGQDEGAEYVGRAFAESLAAVLAEVDELDVVESRESAARVLTGTLTREGEEIQAAVRLIDAEHDDTTVWLLDVRSDGDSLSSLASGVARRVVDALDVVPPDLYEYIDDVALGPEIAASPLAARVDDARRRGDIPELVEASLALSERYGDEPTPHVLNAWALMRAWDADPSGETLARLKDRLVALQRVDPPSPYDELIRAYVYRSSGEPDQARTLYSQVLARGDLSTGARSWALRQRSLAALQVGDAAAARRDAEQAVALDPSSALNLVALSKALETLKLIDAAAEASTRALTLEPHQWRHHQRLGIVYLRGERFDESVRSIGRACEMGESQEACANLAVALARAGRGPEGGDAARHAASLTATPWGFYNLACYHAVAGDRAGAIGDLRRAFDLGFTDVLITTDPDLGSLRGDPDFEAIVAEVEGRLRVRHEISDSIFPWQG